MFDQLTELQKERLLKTLVVLALNSNPTVELLDDYTKYAAEAFDSFVDVSVQGDVVSFKRKGSK